MARITNRQAESKIAEQEAFETRGSLWAMKMTGSTFSITTGQLPQKLAEELKRAVRMRMVTYVVYSGRTPIAWVAERSFNRPEFEVPQISYSDLHRRHQNLVRRVWGMKEV
jgi:hypothetical protein